ncbi:MAG: HprK-related kinase B [Pseudomonadales bacterium]|nr:HprK-related kinase B [Pseudomonadales bacterium]
MIKNAEQAAATLIADTPLEAKPLFLQMGEFSLTIKSNSASLLAGLARYFSHLVVAAPDSMALTRTLCAIESPPLDLDIEFTDWRREPGKTGRKDSYHDLEDGRLLLKVRTGMIFLQSEHFRIAAGPCEANDNQVINFINAQYANWLQQQGFLTCHAAGVVQNGRGFAMAGFSGGGKSTLMLRLLDNEQINYLTNDRLYIQQQGNQVYCTGIPKLPRVNPGTIVHNPKLQALISESRRQELLAMPPSELWDLEEKYDVFVDDVYGDDRITYSAPLGAFLILNWQRDSGDAFAVEAVDIATRSDLLAAVMKSPGPFYQRADGSFYRDNLEIDAQQYLANLQGVRFYEARGCVDFAALVAFCQQHILE